MLYGYSTSMYGSWLDGERDIPARVKRSFYQVGCNDDLSRRSEDLWVYG